MAEQTIGEKTEEMRSYMVKLEGQISAGRKVSKQCIGRGRLWMAVTLPAVILLVALASISYSRSDWFMFGTALVGMAVNLYIFVISVMTNSIHKKILGTMDAMEGDKAIIEQMVASIDSMVEKHPPLKDMSAEKLECPTTKV